MFIAMETRLDYYAAAPKSIDRLRAFTSHLQREFFDPKLQALVELRVSQLNGCAYCVNKHTQEVRALGETQLRLDNLPVWHEVDCFTDREKAALLWAESVTFVSETRVPEEVYFEARRHFTNEELTLLTISVSMTNLWNRIAVSFRKPVALTPESTEPEI